MKALLKKEFTLCLHPTAYLFLAFCVFVFIPNYPYEVMFFFSGLSVFFICLTARENGDAAFTSSLPVRREYAVYARVLTCAIFQITLLMLAGITTAIKEACFPPAIQMNAAGSTANLAFIGYGAIIMGTFNLTFFPIHYKNTNKVGIPFVLASALEFLLIALLIVFRYVVPLFRDVLNLPDPEMLWAKAVVLLIGLAVYACFTCLAAWLGGKIFRSTDL